jgi:NADH dehydrogenase
LVDTQEEALFTPRLVDALAQACREEDLRAPHTSIAKQRGYTFIQGKASVINHEKKTVVVETTAKELVLAYDALVCAYGAKTNFYSLEGTEHTFPFKTWDHLLAIEERLHPLINNHTSVHVGIIGGGATGIELAFALQKRLALLGVKDAQRQITIFQASPQILPGFLPKTIERATKRLQEKGITIQLTTPVKTVAKDHLVTKKGESVPLDFVIWTAGICPNVVECDIQAADTSGALIVDHTLRLAPHVYAGGDVIQFREKLLTIPKNAQTAMKMGAVIAKNILCERDNKPLATFHYRSAGVMLWMEDATTFDLFGVSLFSKALSWVRKMFYQARWRAMSQ